MTSALLKRKRILKKILFAFTLLFTLFIMPNVVSAASASDKAYIDEGYLYQVAAIETDVDYTSGIFCHSPNSTCSFVSLAENETGVDYSVTGIQEVDVLVEVVTTTAEETTTEIITLTRYYYVPNPVYNEETKQSKFSLTDQLCTFTR